MSSEQYQYLGDGLYASFDGYQFILTANIGGINTQTVYLEPQVLEAFIRYIEKTKNKITKGE